MPLLDQYGREFASSTRRRRRVAPPDGLLTGDVLGQWAGQNLMYMTMPGGTILQFDLDKLTLEDFRQMRNNYQLSASLNVLTFMIHQMDWKIECEDKSITEMLETNMHERWTRLIRALSQSFWAGYSPSCIVYENNPKTDYLEVSKFKDLVPEQCRVHWHYTDGANLPSPAAGSGTLDSSLNLIGGQTRIPPKIANFDGIRHYPQTGVWGDGGHGPWFGGYGITGTPVVIPAENSLWYPLLMENGDHYGRKLLKPAFPAYYFSQLIHLFANRYFERFGEPTPIGRANYEDDVQIGSTTVNGKQAMEQILNSLRNRSVVVLPSDRDPDTKDYEYSIEYLESTMRGRGADFEQYLSRLDEEMSLAVFTPMLLFRTAAVGSYNLGNIHLQVFQQMLNSIAGDAQEYIQHYVIDRLVRFNFGDAAPPARWVFRPLGKGDMQTYQLLLQALVSQGMASPDLEELSVATGITMDKIKQVTEPPPAPADPAAKVAAQRDLRSMLGEAVERFGREANNGRATSFGFRNRFQENLQRLGYDAEEASDETAGFYGRVNRCITELVPIAATPEDLRDSVGRVVEHAAERFLGAA